MAFLVTDSVDGICRMVAGPQQTERGSDSCRVPSLRRIRRCLAIRRSACSSPDTNPLLVHLVVVAVVVVEVNKARNSGSDKLEETSVAAAIITSWTRTGDKVRGRRDPPE